MTDRVVNVPISYSALHLACSVLLKALTATKIRAIDTAKRANDPEDILHDYALATLSMDEQEALDAKTAYEAINNALVDATLAIRPDGYLFAEEFQM